MKEDTLKEKEKGGDPSKALCYKVAQMLNEVGRRDNNLTDTWNIGLNTS